MGEFLNDSCEDMFLTQNSFHPPVDCSVDSQLAGDAADCLLSFDDNSTQNSVSIEEFPIMDFQYQIDNSSSVLTPLETSNATGESAQDLPSSMVEKLSISDDKNHVS